MALNPLKVFLFVVGGVVAAAGTAFYAGAWRPEAAAPRQAALNGQAGAPAAAPADAQTAPGKQAKPEQQASVEEPKQAAPSAATGDAPPPAGDASAGTEASAMSAAPVQSGDAPAAPLPEVNAPAADEAQQGAATPQPATAAPATGNPAPAAAETQDAASAPPPDAGPTTPRSASAANEPAAVDQEPAIDAAPAAPAAGAPAQAAAETQDAASAPKPDAGSALAPPAPNADKPASAEQQTALQPDPDGAATPAAPVAPAAAASAEAGTSPADPNVPTFDVVRVEPDGSTVVAGRAGPDAKVELMLGAQVLASTTAGPEGDFAIVLDEPLKPGDHQIQLKGTVPGGASETSDQTALVSVPEGGSGQVLAMVEEPGAPSRVLTAPEATPAAAPKASETSSTASLALGSEPVGQDAPPAAEATPADPTPQTQEEQQASLAMQPAPANAQADPSGADAGATEAAKVSVQAVEIEGRKIYVAGLAAPGSSVRAYADDAVLGDAAASATGEFLVEATHDLIVGNHSIRVDQLNSDGSVLARAVVPFEREAGVNVAAVAPGLDGGMPAAPPVTASDAPAAPNLPVENDTVAAKPAEVAQGDTSNPLTTNAPEYSGDAMAAAGAADPAVSAPVTGQSEPSPQSPAASETPGDVIAGAQPGDVQSAPTEQDIASADSAPLAQEEPQSSAAPAAVALPQPDPAMAATPTQPSVALPSSAPSDAGAASTTPLTQEEPENKTAPAVASPSQQASAPSAPGIQAPEVPSDSVASGPDAPAAAQSAAAASPGTQAIASSEPTAAAAGQSPETAVPPEPPVISPQPQEAGDPASSTAEQAVASADSAGDVATAPKLHNVQGAVIIRRGDSLWRISRRVYGYGTRYSTIYLANQDQIRNPDLIMPGQVFAVPNRSEQGETADMDALGDQKASRME